MANRISTQLTARAAVAKLAAMVAIITLIALAAFKTGIADEAMLGLGMVVAPVSRTPPAGLG